MNSNCLGVNRWWEASARLDTADR